MVPRWRRNVVAITAALVAWLVAAPAHASAPLCDPRGATMIAPAPELEAPLTSLDAAAPVDDAQSQCTIAQADGRAWSGGHAPSPRISSPSALAAALAAAVTRLTVRSPRIGSCVARDDSAGERAGERGRVDRPPRG
jgi:hypothetical protein